MWPFCSATNEACLHDKLQPSCFLFDWTETASEPLSSRHVPELPSEDRSKASAAAANTADDEALARSLQDLSCMHLFATTSPVMRLWCIVQWVVVAVVLFQWLIDLIVPVACSILPDSCEHGHS